MRLSRGFQTLKSRNSRIRPPNAAFVNRCLTSASAFRLLTCLQPYSKFLTGAEVLELRKSCFKIKTGSEQLDKILNGGFESRSVSEVYGEYRCGMNVLSSCTMTRVLNSRTGKTQLSMTMAVQAQLPVSQGGAAGKVAIIGICSPRLLVWLQLIS